MADIRDVALDTAVDNEATCGASVSLCSACVMSATSPSSKMMLMKKLQRSSLVSRRRREGKLGTGLIEDVGVSS